ncbi:hypothetical protein F5Y04DRAFT_249454 [Hypomontagnella monticulosa]|nr:hypothetical protein F5Y04DRAFT_249454 [Hypomontagnella monticulosa]
MYHWPSSQRHRLIFFFSALSTVTLSTALHQRGSSLHYPHSATCIGVNPGVLDFFGPSKEPANPPLWSTYCTPVP